MVGVKSMSDEKDWRRSAWKEMDEPTMRGKTVTLPLSSHLRIWLRGGCQSGSLELRPRHLLVALLELAATGAMVAVATVPVQQVRRQEEDEGKCEQKCKQIDQRQQSAQHRSLDHSCTAAATTAAEATAGVVGQPTEAIQMQQRTAAQIPPLKQARHTSRASQCEDNKNKNRYTIQSPQSSCRCVAGCAPRSHTDTQNANPSTLRDITSRTRMNSASIGGSCIRKRGRCPWSSWGSS